MKPSTIIIPCIDLILSIIILICACVVIVPYTYAHTYIYGMCISMIFRVIGYIPWWRKDLPPEFYSRTIHARETSTELLVQLSLCLFWLLFGLYFSFPLFFVGFHGMWLYYLGVDEVIAHVIPKD